MAKVKKKKVSLAEANFARYFLKLVGSNPNNSLLITAVVTWLRYNSAGKGIFNAKGNNPFNVTKTSFVIFPFGFGGYTERKRLSFKSIHAAARYTARMFNSGSKIDGYDLIRNNLRNNKRSEKGMQAQAYNFLFNLGLTRWDVNQYGYVKGSRTNNLINLWSGVTWTIAQASVKQPAVVQPKPKPPPKPRPTSDFLLNEGMGAEYIDPLAAKRFYEAKHKLGWGMGNLPDDGDPLSLTEEPVSSR